MLETTRSCLSPRSPAFCAQTRRPGGTVAGTYRLVRLIAQGGMGALLEAWDSRVGRRVAVKLPLDQDSDNPAVLEFIRSEARLLSRIDHPNVVRLLDHGEDDMGPFIVLEHLDGETIADRLSRTGPFPTTTVIRIVTELARALKSAHAAGVVHCDVKPANVFLTRTSGASAVKLLDFGISVDADGPDDEACSPPPSGTPSYMAPEQALGFSRLDHRVDQFSLAATAYELLSGKRAFTRHTPRALGSAVPPRPLPMSSVAPWIPSTCDAVLGRAMSVSPDDRYEDVPTFAAAFAEAARWKELTPLQSAEANPVDSYRSVRDFHAETGLQTGSAA